MADSNLYERDPNLTFSEPTTPSGRFASGILGSLLNPIIKPSADNRRSVVDNTGQLWREADAGSGIYYKFGTRGFASVNLGASSPSSPSSGSGTSGGSVGYSEGTGGMLGGGNFDTSGNPIGPYPFENVFFPQLTQAYERPAGNDYRNLFASYGFTGPLAQMEGAYEPGTVEGAALVPGGILEYQPPRLNTGLPTFVGNPYGSLQLPDNWEELLTLGEEEEREGSSRTSGRRAANHPETKNIPEGQTYSYSGTSGIPTVTG